MLIFAKHRHHEFESFSARDFNGSRTEPPEPLQLIEISGKNFGKRALFGEPDMPILEREIIQKPLRFVQRSCILLRCGSALRYRCPPWAFPP